MTDEKLNKELKRATKDIDTVSKNAGIGLNVFFEKARQMMSPETFKQYTDLLNRRFAALAKGNTEQVAAIDRDLAKLQEQNGE